MNKKILEENCNDFLDEIMNLNDLPGLAIGVSIGESVSIGVRGYRDYAARTPLEPDDIFHCASVSKLFTSSAIMLLVEAGVLNLEDRLCDILPNLHIVDTRWKEIRLWNMLTHTSGLGDVEDYHWYDCETDANSLRRYVYESEEVLARPMLWEPQMQPAHQIDSAAAEPSAENRFRYSNIAYEILGQIISEYSDLMTGDGSNGPDNSGKLSYEDFVAEYLLKPAGMTSSTMKTYERVGLTGEPEDGCAIPAHLLSANSLPAHMAHPHEKKSDRSIGPVKYYPYTRQHAPSSTLTSNVRDLLLWGRAHLVSSRGESNRCESGSGKDRSGDRCSGECRSCGTPLLRPETYRKIWQPYAVVPNNGEKMGLGWFMREQTVSIGGTRQPGSCTPRTYRLFGHEGTDDGFRASFWICPELDMVTVVLSNLSGAPVKRINKKLFETVVCSTLRR